MDAFTEKRLREAIYDALSRHIESAPDGMWRSKSGQVTFIRDMDNGYLRNCIFFCRKKGLQDTGKYYQLEYEAQLRGWDISEDEFLLSGGL